MKVTFHPAAEAELREAMAFYEERSAGLGQAFGGEVRHAVERVLDHAEAGMEVRPGIRRTVLATFPFSLLYAPSWERIRILAVMHHRRDPRRWESRV